MSSVMTPPPGGAPAVPGRAAPQRELVPLTPGAATYRRARPYRGLVPRFLAVHRHVAGLLAGAVLARAAALAPERRHRLRPLLLRGVAALLRPFVRSDLRHATFPRHLRRRLELLGTTYIKLGQIMAARQDLLPAEVCRELAHLFDEVPPVPFADVQRLLTLRLGAPPHVLFESIDPVPLGSASIAQVHRARTADGDEVVIKVMKPGIRTAVLADLKLLHVLGWLLQRVLHRYQPLRIIDEFSAYTARELDFTVEADNAETFAANFRDTPDVKFPAIHRSLSCDSVLTMEYLDGFKPHAPAAAALTAEERQRLIDIGASAIIRMLYRDGFFHADLHPANLLVLPGNEHESSRIGFIDLGMAGRFEPAVRRRLLYYYHALVTGDADAAATYLGEMAEAGPEGDRTAFRRDVADLSRRFLARSERGDISIAQLILESVGLGARHRVYFPVELTLMVKALVTFEGVGRALDPQLDVAALSRLHVTHVLKAEFAPATIIREMVRQAPELMDLAVRLPHLLAESGRFLEQTFSRRPPGDPTAGLRSAVLAGACVVAGVIAFTGGAPTALWAVLFAVGAALAVLGR